MTPARSLRTPVQLLRAGLAQAFQLHPRCSAPQRDRPCGSNWASPARRRLRRSVQVLLAVVSRNVVLAGGVQDLLLPAAPLRIWLRSSNSEAFASTFFG